MIYVMSDIHGCLNRYRNVLRQIRLRKDDHLYILGDVIDRGPEGLVACVWMTCRNSIQKKVCDDGFRCNKKTG